ncbi:MAG TPA: nuclear transport factor 2 family protein [Pyrinomonadaceae bacterium]|nr:nuclear transport factor 2 family protein [Pyrinomonadaceae bacterium]
MKKLCLLLATVCAAAGLLRLAESASAARNPEEAAVRAAIEHYFRGHSTGQGEHFRKVFHPDSKLYAVRDGKFWTLTSEEYAARAAGKPAPDEAQRKRWVESVDISGNAAVAKVVLDYPTVRFTDYMSMLKIDGEWKIVNKTFAEQRRQ